MKPGLLQAAEVELVDGVLFDRFHDERAASVAIVGAAVARQFGISDVVHRPAVFIDQVAFTVIGIIKTSERLPQLGLAVLLPGNTAVKNFGPAGADEPPEMLIRTELGAAPLIARQAALTLRPDDPQALKVIPPPQPKDLERHVAGTLNGLVVVL